jgi:hypothetical protein
MSTDDKTWLGPERKVAYSASAIEFGSRESGPAGVTAVSVRVHLGHAWHLRMSAPKGTRLEAGEYTHAQSRNDVNHPGLDVSGAGRGCSGSSGSFTVHEIEYGPHDYVERFWASFDFSCHPGAPRLRGDLDLVAEPPPEPLTIDVALESARVTKDELSEGISIELAGSLVCNRPRPVTAALSVEIVVESATAPVESEGGWDCSSEPHPWTLGMSASDPHFATETPVATIVAQATDALYTDIAGGDQVVAEDRIDGAEVDPLPRPGGDAAAIGLEWLTLIAAAAVALTGWSFLVLRWARARRRPA